MNSVPQKHQAVRFFIPQSHQHSKKTFTFVFVLRKHPKRGIERPFNEIINGSVYAILPTTEIWTISNDSGDRQQTAPACSL